MIRQVAGVRNGLGCRKRTLMKAQAELPSLRLRYCDWRLCLGGQVRCVFVRKLFSGTDSLPPGALAPSGPHLVQPGGGQYTATGPRECLVISE